VSVLDLLLARPDSDQGAPIGVDNWRLAVQAVIPRAGDSTWDVSMWGTDTWSQLTWTDLSPWVRGVEWHRGADSPGSRPDVGVLNVTLDDRSGRWSPWGSAAINVILDDEDPVIVDGEEVELGGPGFPTLLPPGFGPGTVIRVVAHEPDKGWWVPQFAGRVESWPQSLSGLGADQFVTVTVIETVSALAKIDNNALGAPVGVGESVTNRIYRLLSLAGWRYGYVLESSNAWPMQSTEMTTNRLTECYLTADSADVDFLTHRSGQAWVTDVDPRLHPVFGSLDVARWGEVVWERSLWSVPLDELWTSARLASVFYSGVEFHPSAIGEGRTITVDGRRPVRLLYDGDSFRQANDIHQIRNDIRLARAGGSEQLAESGTSIGLYDRATYSRNDLMLNSDYDVATLADRLLDRKALDVLRLESIELHGRTTAELGSNLPALFIIDVGDAAYCVIPDTLQAKLMKISSLTHRVVAATETRLQWSTSAALESVSDASPAIVTNVADDTSTHLSTPDHADFAIPGDMSMILKGSARRPFAEGARIMLVNHPGSFRVYWLHDSPSLGSGLWMDFIGTPTMSHFLGIGDFPVLDMLAERDVVLGITFDANDGTSNHEVKVWLNRDGAGWTLLYNLGGTGLTTRGTATGPLTIGNYVPTFVGVEEPISGAIAHFSLWDGLGAGGAPGGDLVTEYNAIPGQVEYLDRTGKTWTVNGTGYGWHYMPGSTPEPAL
jgi:hypothetical protein